MSCFCHPSFDSIINMWPKGGGRSGWPCGLRCTSAATWLLESRVRNPMRAWVFSLVFVVWYVGSGVCDRLITRSEESYRLHGGSNFVWYKTSRGGVLGPILVVRPRQKKKKCLQVFVRKPARNMPPGKRSRIWEFNFTTELIYRRRKAVEWNKLPQGRYK